MKSILEERWSCWQTDGGAPWSVEKRRLADSLTRSEDALRGSLTEGQLAALEAYEEERGAMECLCEKDAFLRGVRFLLEAAGE